MSTLTAALYARQHVHTTCNHTAGEGKNRKRCSRKPTRYVQHTWWCAEHAPAAIPDPACTHSLTNVHFGVAVCSWCGGHLTKETT